MSKTKVVRRREAWLWQIIFTIAAVLLFLLALVLTPSASERQKAEYPFSYQIVSEGYSVKLVVQGVVGVNHIARKYKVARLPKAGLYSIAVSDVNSYELYLLSDLINSSTKQDAEELMNAFVSAILSNKAK